MRLAGHIACMRKEESIRDVGGKARKKEISRKTKT
jgi:hypothetical protein